jgi:hypothetical protein
VTHAAIRLQLNKTNPRSQRGGDLTGQRKLIADKLKFETTPVVQQQRELADTLVRELAWYRC